MLNSIVANYSSSEESDEDNQKDNNTKEDAANINKDELLQLEMLDFLN